MEFYTIDINLHTGIVDLDTEFAKRLGYDVKEIQALIANRYFSKLIPKEDMELLTQIYQDLSTSKTGKTASYQLRLIAKDGQVKRFNWLYSLNESCIHCIVKEIFSYRNAEQLLESERPGLLLESFLKDEAANFHNDLSEIVKDFFEYSIEYMCVIDTDCRIQFINNVFLKDIVYKKKQLINTDFKSFLKYNKQKFKQLVEDVSLGLFRDELEIVFDNDDSHLILSVNVIRLDRQYLGLIARDISELRIAKSEVKSLNEELQKVNLKLRQQNNMLEAQLEEKEFILEKLKSVTFTMDQFNYQVSHNIRSPVASILGLLNVKKLQNGYTDIDDKISQSAIQLDMTIKSMNDYYYNLKTPFASDKIDFTEIVGRIVHYCTNQYDIDIDLEFDLVGHEKISFDRRRTEIILNVLINNAFKFRDPNKQKHLLAVKIFSRKSLQISVKDNGIGIAQERIEKLGTIFYKAHTNYYEGAGLGLYNVQSIVRSAGGRIKIKSKENSGTSVVVTLPLNGKAGQLNSNANESY